MQLTESLFNLTLKSTLRRSQNIRFGPRYRDISEPSSKTEPKTNKLPLIFLSRKNLIHYLAHCTNAATGERICILSIVFCDALSCACAKVLLLVRKVARGMRVFKLRITLRDLNSAQSCAWQKKKTLA